MSNITLQEINDRVRTDMARAVREAEQAYTQKLRSVAEEILSRPQCRVVLLAGPSGSGKTTSANLLKDLLISLGHPTAVVSLDNFYRSHDEEYPLTAEGEQDYENVTALHIPKLHACLEKIIARQDCMLPRYDFHTGHRTDEAEPLNASVIDYTIIEGLHALNPMITDGLPTESLYKLFISVSTNVDDETGRIISGRKVRFLRRMTRDSLYRGADAGRTLELWPGVLHGEDTYLYPYRDLADRQMDTFHFYEIGALRPFAQKVLEASSEAAEDEFAQMVYSALIRFEVVEHSLIPEHSLLLEFMPGGKYEELY